MWTLHILAHKSKQTSVAPSNVTLKHYNGTGLHTTHCRVNVQAFKGNSIFRLLQFL